LKCPARGHFRHDAVCAQLDLPDFFENLAGNHGKNSLMRLRIAPVKNPACANESKE
jgi:hypothetical protein